MLVAVKYMIGFGQASKPCYPNYVHNLLWVQDIDEVWILRDHSSLHHMGKVCFDDDKAF